MSTESKQAVRIQELEETVKLYADKTVELQELVDKHSQASELVKLLRNCDDFPSKDLSGDWQRGVHCGVEDFGCVDKYDGADYGYSQGVAACVEWLRNKLIDYHS